MLQALPLQNNIMFTDRGQVAMYIESKVGWPWLFVFGSTAIMHGKLALDQCVIFKA